MQYARTHVNALTYLCPSPLNLDELALHSTDIILFWPFGCDGALLCRHVVPLHVMLPCARSYAAGLFPKRFFDHFNSVE